MTGPGSRDQGSASLWALAVGLLVMAFAWAAVLVGLAVDARHRAESAADLSALAGAGAAEFGGDGCGAAAGTAVANQAVLVRCSLAADGSVTVEVAVALPAGLARWTAGPATATSRAGT